jgi:hypothetical protein
LEQLIRTNQKDIYRLHGPIKIGATIINIWELKTKANLIRTLQQTSKEIFLNQYKKQTLKIKVLRFQEENNGNQRQIVF